MGQGLGVWLRMCRQKLQLGIAVPDLTCEFLSGNKSFISSIVFRLSQRLKVSLMASHLSR